VLFTTDNLISKIDSLKRKWKSKKKNKNTTDGTPSTWVWFDQCDRIWGQTPKIQGIQGAIDVGDSDEEVEAVDVGGPSKPTSLDLNKPIEVEKYKTSRRKSPRRKIHMEQPHQQMLTPRTAATTSPNVSGRKVAKKKN
jgi:hypothetical protein